MTVVANHVFKALSDPTRRAIFEGLTRDGEQTVHALTRRAGVSQPAVSKHLTVLKRAKLVAASPRGTRNSLSRSNPRPWRRWWTGSISTAHSGATDLINSKTC